jgi:hypothetical protein
MGKKKTMNLFERKFYRNTVTPRYSLFAENGVIVRNLNYRPWQWVYSISGCKSFPGGF